MTDMTDMDDAVLEPEEDGENGSPAQKIKKLREERDRARTEAQEYLTGWQRTKADYVNLAKRMRAAGDAASIAGLAALVKSIVPVFDSLEAARKAAADAPEGVQKGLEQVTGQLESALREHGVERYTPNSGDDFNPVFHEPTSTLATLRPEEDNTIAETHQSGWRLNDTVLRPARVSVKQYTHGSGE